MNARQKVMDLVELACDIHTSDEERKSAAMKAVALIRKHNLLSSPLDGLLDSGNETIQAAASILDKLTDPDLLRSVKKVGEKMKIGRRRRR